MRYGDDQVELTTNRNVPPYLRPATKKAVAMLERLGIDQVEYTVTSRVMPSGEKAVVITFRAKDPLEIIQKASDLYVEAKNRWNTKISTIRLPSVNEFEMIFIRGTALEQS